jgi:transcriptional regulator with XRE-family HTH domain
VTSSEFGEYIFNIRRENGISRPTFSKKWGYHVNTIKSYEKDGRLPPVEYIAALSIETGSSFVPLVSLLLSVGPLANTEHSHTLSTLMTGQPALSIGEQNASYSKEGSTLHYRVENDSMTPTIVKDAVVTYETYKDNSQIKDGSILLLSIEQSLMLRRVQFTNDKQYVLSCDNAHFSSSTYTKSAFEKLSIVGVVRYTLNPV